VICSKCKIEKPPEEFTKNRTCKSGYGCECKQCVRERAKERYAKNPEKYRKRNQHWIIQNKDKQLEMQRQWREKNKEHIKNYDKEYRKDNEEVHAKARERLRVWVRNNPERHRINKANSSRKRRAVKQNRESNLTASQINALIKNSNNICFWCDREIPKGKMHLDHITPLSKGGDDTINNLVVSCASCNLRKSDKSPEVWLDEILSISKN